MLYGNGSFSAISVVTCRCEAQLVDGITDKARSYLLDCSCIYLQAASDIRAASCMQVDKYIKLLLVLGGSGAVRNSESYCFMLSVSHMTRLLVNLHRNSSIS